MFLLLGFALSADPQNFINTETAQLYQLNCSEDLTLRYMSVDKLTLKIRSSCPNIIAKASKLNVVSTKEIDLGLTEVENYFVSQDIELEHDPWELIFTCPAGSTGMCAISPIVSQGVASRGGIAVMGWIAIGMVVAVIGIVTFQFLTFHHPKRD